MLFTCHCLTLLVLHFLSTHSAAQDVSVVCYKSLGGVGEECSPSHQSNTAHSYSECCVVRGDTPNTHRYRLQQEQCSLCGPVLDEALFFPVTTNHDNSTIFIYWGLHNNSLPATHYVMSVGLESKGEEGLTSFKITAQDSSSPSSSSRHQFTPVTAGMVYTISVRAENDDRQVSSPDMSVAWRVGEDRFPSFYNFTTSLLSPTGSVFATWVVLTAGLRPLLHLSVKWVETSAVLDERNLTDPTSSVYPYANIEIMEYDVRNYSQVVMQDDIISLPLRGLVERESYYVGVTATSVLGSKTSVFQFTAEANVSVATDSSAARQANTSLSVLLLFTAIPLLDLLLHSIFYSTHHFNSSNL